jgi:hypothetical protein
MQQATQSDHSGNNGESELRRQEAIVEEVRTESEATRNQQEQVTVHLLKLLLL